MLVWAFYLKWSAKLVALVGYCYNYSIYFETCSLFESIFSDHKYFPVALFLFKKYVLDGFQMFRQILGLITSNLQRDCTSSINSINLRLKVKESILNIDALAQHLPILT
jgi:hypothetical protein